jgi:CheY-like chemotaxis protein
MSHAKSTSPKRLGVLVVSQERYFRGMLVEILAGYGYSSVRTAESLRALFDCLGRLDVDLVILDENMPVLSPFEIARMVRFNPSDGRRPRSVLVVSQATRSIVDQARDAGFDALITRPVIPARLAKTMEHLCQFEMAS